MLCKFNVYINLCRLIRVMIFMLLWHVYRWCIGTYRYFYKHIMCFILLDRKTKCWSLETYDLSFSRETLVGLFLIADAILMCIHSMLIFDIGLVFNSVILRYSPANLYSFPCILIIFISNLILSAICKNRIDFEYIQKVKYLYSSKSNSYFYSYILIALFPFYTLLLMLFLIRYRFI